MINWTELIIAICSLLITGILVPLINNKRKEVANKLTEAQIETINYWVEVGVRWAKQWLQSETGEKKKAEVLDYVSRKMAEIKINVSAEDLDKIIEAIYEQVKAEVEAEEALTDEEVNKAIL